MSKTNGNLNGIIIATVCFIGSVVLFFVGIFFGIAQWQSDVVPGFLISWGLSLVLFIGGIVILWKTRKKPKHKL
jgi:lipopolysaccharide export LptBFGC system permease protein LptF